MKNTLGFETDSKFILRKMIKNISFLFILRLSNI